MSNGVRFLVITDRYFTNQTPSKDNLRFCRTHRVSFHLFGYYCSVNYKIPSISGPLPTKHQ